MVSLYIALIGVGSPVVLLNGSNVFLQLLQLLCTQFHRPTLEGGDTHRWDGVARITDRSSREAAADRLGSRDTLGVLSEYAQTSRLRGSVQTPQLHPPDQRILTHTHTHVNKINKKKGSSPFPVLVNSPALTHRSFRSRASRRSRDVPPLEVP